MSDSTGEATSPATRDLSLQWHEVVHSEQFSEPVKRPTSPGWTWRYAWIVVRYSVLPMLVTALALTTVLLTLIGLVARPFPWSPQPLFGGALGHSHVVSHPTPTPTRTGAAKAPGAVTDPGPAAVASPAGIGSRALPTTSGTGTALPSATPTPSATPGVGVSVGAGLPPLPLLSGVLPSVTLSVRVSLPVPTSILPVPLPPLSVTVPPLPLPVPLPKLSVGVLP